MTDTNLATAAFGGKKTPEQVLITALELARNMKCVVVVGLMDDDELMTASSDGSALTRLGLLEFGKKVLLRSLTVADDDDKGAA